MKKKLLVSLGVTLSCILNGASQKALSSSVQSESATIAAQPIVYAIPGQNGEGSHPTYVANLTGITRSRITAIRTPGTFIADFGQARCQAHLKVITNPGIIHATSQGTATALLYAAKRPNNVTALILEATLASGNSAVVHTASGPLMLPLHSLAKWPGSYYWAPYFAKFLYPLYSPSGTQPIHALENINISMPIIIAHSENDPQLSYTDALALYYRLRARGNTNVYLLINSSMKHIEVLRGYEEVVQRILKKHGLSQSDLTVGDLSPYQPDHENNPQFKVAYDNLIAKEKIHTRIGYGVKVATLAGTLYCLKRLAQSQLAQRLFRNIPRVAVRS